MKKNLKKVSLKIMFILLIKSYSINVYSNTQNYKKINNQLNQLEHISKAYSQYLTQLQKQLLNMEQEIDYLRGQIQENEHQLFVILDKQNSLIKEINLITNKNLNKSENNVIFSPKKTCNYVSPSTTDNIDFNLHFSIYNQAVNLVLKKKQYENAMQAFQEFILKYPNSPYQANAYYWLGQLNYRKGNKNEASYYFALVAKDYPKSSKASDSLLKVGVIMEENGNKDTAKSIYKKVCYSYPNTDSAKNSRKRLKNMKNH